MNSLHAHIGILHAQAPMHQQLSLLSLYLLMLVACGCHGNTHAYACHFDDTHPMPGTKPQQLVQFTVQSPARKAHRLLAEILCRNESHRRALCCCNPRPQSINAVPSTRYAVSPLQASKQEKK